MTSQPSIATDEPHTREGTFFATLVEADRRKYAAADQTETATVRLSGPTSPDIQHRLASLRRWTWVPGLALGLVGAVTGIVYAVTSSETAGLVAIMAIALLVAALSESLGEMDSLEIEAEAARNRTVPAPAAEALERLRSAVAETDRLVDAGAASIEAAATLRVMRDHGESLIQIVADHHADRTVNDAEARDACAELFRLAAEADAYLSLRHHAATRAETDYDHPEIEAARYTTLTGVVATEGGAP